MGKNKVVFMNEESFNVTYDTIHIHTDNMVVGETYDAEWLGRPITVWLESDTVKLRWGSRPRRGPVYEDHTLCVKWRELDSFTTYKGRLDDISVIMLVDDADRLKIHEVQEV